MSGFEVVGAVLGVLPLLISALEHYDDALKPFVRYKHFSSRFRDYCDELEVYRTIFRTECVLLIGVATTKDVAIAMIDDPRHQSWNDQSLGDRLDKRLGSLGSACMVMIQRIEKKLEYISARSTEFDTIAGSPTSVDPKADKDWKRRVSKKLKFCIRSDKSFQQSLGELSKLNTTFRVLSSQVIQLETKNQPGKPDHNTPDSASKTMTGMDQIRTIREASISLYDSLSCLCTTHDDHLTRFCLDAALRSMSPSQREHHVHFNLSWLGPIGQVPQLQNTKGKSRVDHSYTDTQKEVQTGLKFASPVGMELNIESSLTTDPLCSTSATSSALSPLPSTSTSGLHPDKSLNTLELCKSLDTYPKLGASSVLSSQVVSGTQELSAVLFGKTGSYQHRIRASNKSQSSETCLASQESMSLSKLLLRTTKTGRQVQLPQIFRLCLAKDLSSTMLQYHNTSWLPDSLRSDGLYFTKSIESSKPFAASVVDTTDHLPFVYVPLKSQKSRRTQSGLEVNDSNTSGFPGVIPNETLYHLGILLLELAYNWPFESLVAEVRNDEFCPIPPNLDDSTAEFLISQHLATEVGSKLGSSYANIVQKCLRCDFGCGTRDLDGPELQERVFRDVFRTLEGLVLQME